MASRSAGDQVSQVKPYLAHLTGPTDLVTTYEQRRSTVLATVSEKNDRSIMAIERAKALRVALIHCSSPYELLDRFDLRELLSLAAGIEKDDAKLLTADEITLAIEVMIDDHLIPAGLDFVDELAHRYLLNFDNSRDMALQRLVVLVSRRKLARSIAGSLQMRSTPMLVKFSELGPWTDWSPAQGDLPTDLRGLAWSTRDRPRTLSFNSRLDAVGKRFDVVLRRFGGGTAGATNQDPVAGSCLGVGEIAPFETRSNSWANHGQKTAMDMQRKLADKSPATFFIGSDIGVATADELWSDLQSGVLSNAANVQAEAQMASLSEWLVQL